MSDLHLLIPTRGRDVTPLLEAIEKTSRTDTTTTFGVDDDDDHGWWWRKPWPWSYDHVIGPRKDLVAWTNILFEHSPHEGAYGSIGDDHLPRTVGWDVQILEALERSHVVYSNDLLYGERLATAFFVRGEIPRQLGFMIPPVLQHMYCDNWVMELGRRLGSLEYLPDVIIEHMHPSAGKASLDASYRRSNTLLERDRIAFEQYMAESFESDVRKLTGQPLSSP